MNKLHALRNDTYDIGVYIYIIIRQNSKKLFPLFGICTKNHSSAVIKDKTTSLKRHK